ncbi:MAG: hypothetical protein JWP39_2677, partial [Jatrophihabitans sp.]|nr:hypothetical protein [Jatrophihabitans sp.]
QAHDAGVASAAVNAMQQIGGSIGTAVLSTFARTAATHYACLDYDVDVIARLRAERVVA